ncbi:hypothetical protein OG21DRAFT_1136186 [Imleria badia]|nr:hypothetical protein OG21DRAFT_1136186 [Imleria badia]
MHQQGGSEGPWDAVVPEPASYIRLARIAEVVERTRIAAASYQLTRMNDLETSNTDGRGGPKDPTPTQLAKMRRAMWSILSQDELHRVQRGKENLESHVARPVRTLPKKITIDVEPECAQGWNTVPDGTCLVCV